MTSSLTLPTPAMGKRELRRLAALGVLAAILLLAALANAHAQTVTNGLGSRIQAASTDLKTGGSYALTMVLYVLAGLSVVAAGYTFWQHYKNRNPEFKPAYAIASLLVAGFFATAGTIVNYSSQTISGTNAQMQDQAQQLTYGNG